MQVVNNYWKVTEQTVEIFYIKRSLLYIVYANQNNNNKFLLSTFPHWMLNKIKK